MSNTTFPEPELVLKHTISSDRGREIEIRIYRTPEVSTAPLSQEKAWRWHFGFPETLVSHLCPLLECSPYWDSQHWAERDGWWIWQTSVICESPELRTVRELLLRELRCDLHHLNECIGFFRKPMESKDGSETAS